MSKMEDRDLYTKEIVDYEVSCRPTMPVLDDPKLVRLGDHLHWRNFGTWRDGIVTDIDITYKGPALVTLVRYCHVFGSGMVVQEETRQLDFSKCKVQRYDYEEHCHPPSFVIARAKACIGQKGYNALRNNNDDFCRWSKSGKHTYLCIDETVLYSDIELEVDKGENTGPSTTYISSIDRLNQGDHFAWKSVHSSPTGEDDDGWRHGIVVDIESTSAEIIGFDDTTNSITTITFKMDDVDEYKFRRIIYRRCHMLDEVIDRAKYQVGSKAYSASECKCFGIWCKTGMPQDSDAVETVLVEPKTSEKKEENKEDVAVGKELGNIGVRVSAITVARVGEGAAATAVKTGVKQGSRASAIAVARVGEGAAATAVKTGVKQGSRALVRGAAEGAAAVAAVGVEAVFLAVDVGLTYKSFNRRQISKDELQRRHIQNTFRAAGAAGAGMAGGAAGAAIGTVAFPGIGTIVGGIIGGIVGGISGQVGGHYAGKGIAYAAGRPYDKLFVEDYTEKP